MSKSSKSFNSTSKNQAQKPNKNVATSCVVHRKPKVSTCVTANSRWLSGSKSPPDHLSVYILINNNFRCTKKVKKSFDSDLQWFEFNNTFFHSRLVGFELKADEASLTSYPARVRWIILKINRSRDGVLSWYQFSSV